jgi:4-oxalocrotonate tautomerase
MPFANFKVPAGTLSAEQKETIIHRTTDLYAELYGERARPNTMVLVEEVADGGWGNRQPGPDPGRPPRERPRRQPQRAR